MTLFEYIQQWITSEWRRWTRSADVAPSKDIISALPKKSVSHFIHVKRDGSIYLGGDFVQDESVSMYNGAIWNSIRPKASIGNSERRINRPQNV
jgi:hypothetical protein